MARYEKTKFERVTVVLDGNEYHECELLRCRVIVTRGNFVLKRSRFVGCTFEFAGEAEAVKDLVLGLANPEAKSLFAETTAA